MTRTLILLTALLVPATGFAASPTSDSPPTPPQSPRRPPLLFITTPSGAVPAPAQQAAPTPGSGSTVGYTPAPVPNIDVAPPPGLQHVGPELSGSLVRPHAADGVSDGYMHGSQYSSSLERHSHAGVGVSPTVNLKIPLQYSPQPLR
jgi:hypothetical protein